jgi:hypothetical protein
MNNCYELCYEGLEMWVQRVEIAICIVTLYYRSKTKRAEKESLV